MAYSKAFYSNREEASLRSARAVLPFVLDVIRPRSIVDLGCGTGTWLHAAKGLGIERLLGVEGEWVRRARHLLPSSELAIQDLNDRVSLAERFDLAISLEVAEHLKPARASGFVDDLCAASGVILFGAAIPSQGGTGHVNEQWQSYWAGLFAARGYACMDIVRPRFWKSPDVLPWYKQNAFIYASEPARRAFEERIPSGLSEGRPPLDVVHPEMYSRLFRDPPLRLGMQISRRFAGKVLKAVLPLQGLRGSRE